ncbi:O-antigen ligase family protein [Candidatus Parcubacteria bacterium]|nr:O-antigen ligase family protein [Candidatus Parcubacteria bacterium]
MLSRKFYNILFAGHLVFFFMVIAGVIPRGAVIYETGILALILLVGPLEEGVIFFVRSIPLFLAIPITATFDNFNMWRIFSAILFLKWLFRASTVQYIRSELSRAFTKPARFIKDHPVLISCSLLVLFALLSLIHASDQTVGLKRIIYFINLSLMGIVIWNTARKEFTPRLIRAIAIPTIVVILVGLAQVLSTYLIDIYQFMRIWGEGVQLRQFGTNWSYIATHVGNTWFAYFGEQLSLRTFSLFPDSHSFPIFLLLGIPALFAISISQPLKKQRFIEMIKTRSSLSIVWVVLAFLMIILSGTRGMWAGGLAMVLWVLIVMGWMRYARVPAADSRIFKYISSYLAVFFLLFAIAYPVFASPQFLLSKGNSLLFGNRFKSIIDFGETSNHQRLEIWKASAQSIKNHPIVGVGIGNFPVVLSQDIRLTKAGSSAHNIYLHIASEMGIAALIVSLYLLWLILKKTYDKFLNSSDGLKTYMAGLLITIPWIFAYLMTDVAIFDERAFLLFAVTLGILFAHE